MSRNLLKHYLLWHNFKLVVGTARHSSPDSDANIHRHDDFFELVFVRAGSAEHVAGGQVLQVVPGSVFLLEPGVEHSYRNTQSLNIYNLLFAPEFLRQFREDLSGLPNYQLLFNLRTDERTGGLLSLPDKAFPEVLQLLDSILAEEAALRPGARCAILADFLKVLVIFCRECVVPYVKETQSSYAMQISDLLAALEGKLSTKWSLESMARRARMSTANFRLQFKQLTGETPAAYLLRLRLERAAQLLMRMPGKMVGQIAQDCGFSDSNYFARQFRQKYGVSPTRYRSSG
ncbi:MAG: helix-turn-helix domain-containing protein [Victivallaceae bacterium]|nr:helix-turn-helix domain-containing protein [Victivallaceae bacterium]